MNICSICKTNAAAVDKKSCNECLAKKREITKKHSEKLRAAGICLCGKNPILPGGTCCESCRLRRIKYTQDRTNRQTAQGLCKCGRDKPAPGKKMCFRCGEQSKIRMQTYWSKHVASGLCHQCGKEERHHGKTRCLTCLHKHREIQQKANYGLEKGAVNQMMIDQHGKCKLCPADITSDYHVDHNHETGKVRGLLCPGCNTALGKYQQRILPNLSRITAYLKGQPHAPAPETPAQEASSQEENPNPDPNPISN